MEKGGRRWEVTGDFVLVLSGGRGGVRGRGFQQWVVNWKWSFRQWAVNRKCSFQHLTVEFFNVGGRMGKKNTSKMKPFFWFSVY